MDQDGSKALSFTVARRITHLFVDFLELTENLKAENEIMIKKLKAALPTDFHKFIDAVNTLDPDRQKLIRKRILDIGNRTITEIDKDLEQFEIGINYNR